MKTTNQTWGWIFAFALAAMVALLIVLGWATAGLNYKTGDMLKTGLAIATALFVVALFVERAAAVLYALIFGDELRNAEIELAFATQRDEERAAAAMAEVLGFKERFRLLLAFAAGLMVAIAGTRTLAGLLEAGSPPNPTLFHAVDIVLTASLIAGGSKGIAFIIQMLKDRMANPGGGKVATLRARLMSS